MYEVSNRSVWEHEQFSLNVERRNLKWLYEANKDFIQEMSHVNYFDQLADTGALKGKVFKMKALNPQRLRGLTAFGLTYLGYTNFTAISLLVGPTIPILGLAASAFYGMTSF